MTADAFLYAASIGWLGAKFLTSIFEVIGSNLYVIRQTKRLRRIQAHPHSRSLRQRPLVSVVVYAHNEEATIWNCLESLRCGGYRKLEIIVVEYASRDATRRVVRDYIAAHPKSALRLVVKRVLPRSWRMMSPTRHIHGELIVYLNARQLADRAMVKRAVRHFAAYDINMLIPAIHLRVPKSVLGLIQQYSSLQSSVSAQLGLWQRHRSYIARAHPHPGSARAYYGDDVVIAEMSYRTYWRYGRAMLQTGPMRAPMPSTSIVRRWSAFLYRRLLFIRRSVHVSEPIMVGYFVYLALYAYSPQPLILAWVLGLGSWFLYISADRYSTLRQKIRLAALTPAIQVLLYVRSLAGFMKIFSGFTKRTEVTTLTQGNL